MQEGGVLFAVTFSLTNATPEDVARQRKKYLLQRAKLPKGRSMGCVFKNPQGDFAGRLIEGAGLKGLRVGGAVVSEQHANFILNDRNASSNDIKNLISIVKNAVYAQYKIHLEEEIRYI